VLDILVQSRRNAKAAKRLLRKLLKKQGIAPRVISTDKLTSYGAAKWAAVEHLYGSRILPFDGAAATAAGRLLDKARSISQSPGWADIAIAGTAKAHGLTVLTRNLKHFEPLGIACLDPFKQLPPLP
jgi:predicted nucleic acid-binding protein